MSTEIELQLEDMSLLDQICIELLAEADIDDMVLENLSDEELVFEAKAIKRKVIRDLTMTIKYGGCPPNYKVDSDTKQCVKMSTGEIKLLHKLAKRNAKSFRLKGTGAKLLKNKRRAKSLMVGNRLHLYKAKKKP
jgi:hypothetical protein